jgi:hypothetical protein
MSDIPSNGLGKIAEAELEILKILEQVPLQHRGLLFERVVKTFHAQETTSILELGFALEWADMNRESRSSPILESLLLPDSTDLRKGDVPQNEREWQVAHLTASTLVQWLPTSVGTSFLWSAFRRGGGSFSYTLPTIKKED